MGNTNLLCKKKKKEHYGYWRVLVTRDKKVKQLVVRAQMREEELWRMGLGNLGSRIFCVCAMEDSSQMPRDIFRRMWTFH